MGAEIKCKARYAGQRAVGTVHIEPDVMRFRGAFKVSIKRADMARISAAQGVLTIVGPEGELALELGDKAERWADKILHPPSRLDKLGVKPGSRVVVLGLGDDAFLAELRDRTGDVTVGRLKSDSDLIFLHINAPADLAKLDGKERFLKRNGALWVVFAKGRADIKVSTIIPEGKGRGFIDNRVVRFSDTLTALRFVIPVARR